MAITIDAMQVVPFRLPNALVRRLDAHAARMRRDMPGVRCTRADALRSLLETALGAVEVKEARHG